MQQPATYHNATEEQAKGEGKGAQQQHSDQRYKLFKGRKEGGRRAAVTLTEPAWGNRPAPDKAAQRQRSKWTIHTSVAGLGISPAPDQRRRKQQPSQP